MKDTIIGISLILGLCIAVFIFFHGIYLLLCARMMRKEKEMKEEREIDKWINTNLRIIKPVKARTVRTDQPSVATPFFTPTWLPMSKKHEREFLKPVTKEAKHVQGKPRKK